MDEEVKSKLIMDKEDLAGEEIESTGFSSAENSSNVPKFFKERMAKQHGNTKDGISITELNDDKDVPEFNVPKKQKQAAFRDPYAEMLGMEPGKDPEDYQDSPASRTRKKEKKDTGNKQKMSGGQTTDVGKHSSLCGAYHIHHLVGTGPFLRFFDDFLKQALSIGRLCQLEVV